MCVAKRQSLVEILHRAVVSTEDLQCVRHVRGIAHVSIHNSTDWRQQRESECKRERTRERKHEREREREREREPWHGASPTGKGGSQAEEERPSSVHEFN